MFRKIVVLIFLAGFFLSQSISAQESIIDYEKGLSDAIKLAQQRDQMRFLQGVILPIILIAAASIITVLVIRRKRKQNLVDKKTD